MKVKVLYTCIVLLLVSAGAFSYNFTVEKNEIIAESDAYSEKYYKEQARLDELNNKLQREMQARVIKESIEEAKKEEKETGRKSLPWAARPFKGNIVYHPIQNTMSPPAGYESKVGEITKTITIILSAHGVAIAFLVSLLAFWAVKRKRVSQLLEMYQLTGLVDHNDAMNKVKTGVLSLAAAGVLSAFSTIGSDGRMVSLTELKKLTRGYPNLSELLKELEEKGYISKVT